VARPGVNYFEVAKAAQQITGNGKVPTIEQIRALLGTGSNSTIGAHLKAWKTQQDPSQQLASQANIPEELVALMKGLWERVVREGQAEVEVFKEETQHEITQFKQRIQQLEKENIHWQQCHHQEKKEKEALTQEKAALEQMISIYKSEKAAWAATQEGLNQKLQERQDRIDAMGHQNKQIQANLEHYRAASLEQRQQDRQEAQERIQALEQKNKEIQQAQASALHENLSLKQRHEAFILENSTMKEQLVHISADQERMRTTINELRSVLAEEKSAHQHWKAQHDHLSVKWEEAQNRNIELQSDQAILSQQLKTNSQAIEEIKQQNRELAHDKWILGQEKAQLFGQLTQLMGGFEKKSKKSGVLEQREESVNI
jgi:chromosome segregation ATPase